MAGMGRLGEHSQRAGEQAGQQLEQRDQSGGEDGEDRGCALGGVRGWAGRECGLRRADRKAHGRDANAFEGLRAGFSSCGKISGIAFGGSRGLQPPE